MNGPLVTVLLTCHDRYEFLRRAVESVFAQTYQNWELVVLDDESKDPRIGEYLAEQKAYAHALGKPMVHHRPARAPREFREKHKMVAVRINAGLGLGRGKFFAYLGDDNAWGPGHLENVCGALIDGADVAFDLAVWERPDGPDTPQGGLRYTYRQPYLPGHKKLLEAIAPESYIVTDCAAHRRTRACCGRWETSNKLNRHTPVDWRFWLTLHRDEGWRFVRVPKVGARCMWPGAWRKGANVAAVLDRERDLIETVTPKEAMMNKNKNRGEFVTNTSGKNQQFVNPSTQKVVFVKKDARVKRSLVMFEDANGNQRMWPGFTLEARAPRRKRALNEIAQEAPETGEVLYDVVSESEEVERPVVSSVNEDTTVEPESLPSPSRSGRVCLSCGGPVSKGSKTGICAACYRKGARPGNL